MQTAIIISKFPDSYVEGTISKKLLSQNILVKRIYHPARIGSNFDTNVDFIFIMTEKMSHPEFWRIQGMLAGLKKTSQFLSRKSSNWNFRTTQNQTLEN